MSPYGSLSQFRQGYLVAETGAETQAFREFPKAIPGSCRLLCQPPQTQIKGNVKSEKIVDPWK